MSWSCSAHRNKQMHTYISAGIPCKWAVWKSEKRRSQISYQIKNNIALFEQDQNGLR